MNFSAVPGTKLDLLFHLLAISFAYLSVLCSWEKHTISLHFWPLEQFSLFPPFSWFQQFYQSKFGTIVFFRYQTQTRITSSAILIHQTSILYRQWKQSYLLGSHLQLKNIRKALIVLASLSESCIRGRQVETPPWCSFTQNRVRIWQSSEVSAWIKQDPCSLHEMCSEKWPVMFIYFPPPPTFIGWVFFGCFWVFQIDMTNSTSKVENMLKQKLTSPEDQNQDWSKCVARSSTTKYQNLFNPITCRYSILKNQFYTSQH